MEYRTFRQEKSCDTLVISRSKFITYCFKIDSAEAANACLEELRREHPFATHICFAYVADASGNVQKFSDDGEPKGTAGIPILDVLQKRGLKYALIAVVRYFGGVKLGAGGLVRAYSGAASAALDKNGICTMKECGVYLLSCSFLEAARLKNIESAKELSREYTDAVCIKYAITEEKRAGFEEALRQILKKEPDLTVTGSMFCPSEIDTLED